MAWQPNKCCCCVPLRPGLLVWAYIKLVLILSLAGWLVFVTLEDYRHTQIIARYHGRYTLTILEILLLLLPFLFCLLNLVFTIIFIIGVQRKHYKLLLVFLVYSVIEAVLVTGYLVYTLSDAVMWLAYQYYGAAKVYSTWSILFIAVYILLSIYLIVLVKSEMLIMKKDGLQFSAVLDKPVKKQQDERYAFIYSNGTVRGKPLFPVEELERARKQLGVTKV